MPLPPGLDPVTAGRFGLWLLGKRQQQRALKRRVSPTRVFGTALAARFVGLVLPWSVEEYPGYQRFLAEVCGVSVRTCERWVSHNDKLPAKHAETLAALCRTRAGQYAVLAGDLEAYAAASDTLRGRAKALRDRRRGGEV